jgi:hypothetical protein
MQKLTRALHPALLYNRPKFARRLVRLDSLPRTYRARGGVRARFGNEVGGDDSGVEDEDGDGRGEPVWTEVDGDVFAELVEG